MAWLKRNRLRESNFFTLMVVAGLLIPLWGCDSQKPLSQPSNPSVSNQNNASTIADEEVKGLISNWLEIFTEDEVDLLTGLIERNLAHCRVIPSELGTPGSGDFKVMIRERQIPGYGAEPYALIQFLGQGGIQPFGDVIQQNFTRPMENLTEAPAEGYAPELELKMNQPYVGRLRDGVHHFKLLPIGLSGRYRHGANTYNFLSMMVYVQPFAGRRLDPSQDRFEIDTSALYRWKLPEILRPHFSPDLKESFRILTPLNDARYPRNEQVVLAGLGDPYTRIEIKDVERQFHWSVEPNKSGLWTTSLSVMPPFSDCSVRGEMSTVSVFQDGCADRKAVFSAYENDLDGAPHAHTLQIIQGTNKKEMHFIVQAPANRLQSTRIDFGFFTAEIPFNTRVLTGVYKGETFDPHVTVSIEKIDKIDDRPTSSFDLQIRLGDTADALLSIRDNAETFSLGQLTGYRRQREKRSEGIAKQFDEDIAIAGGDLVFRSLLYDPLWLDDAHAILSTVIPQWQQRVGPAPQ